MAVEIIHGNCMDLFEGIYDVMIVDPPYSPHVHKNATSQSAKGGTRHRDLGFDHLSDELREFIAHVAARNVKTWSLIYSDVEGLTDWRTSGINAGAQYIRAMPWVRWSMPQLSGDRPPQGCEMISLFWGTQKGKKFWNGPGNLTHLSHTCLRGEDKHKAEKPLDQILDLVTWFSKPGDHIVDLTAGHGTVGLACKLLGRNYTGYEISEEWARKSTERINRVLDERDQKRYDKWVAAKAVLDKEMERMKCHTKSVKKN